MIPNQPVFKAACLTEKQPIPILYSLRLELTIYKHAAIFATHHAKPMGINSLTRNYIPELKIVPSNLTISVQMF
jgi:hypothetical protein